jgi:hypothetical protein
MIFDILAAVVVGTPNAMNIFHSLIHTKIGTAGPMPIALIKSSSAIPGKECFSIIEILTA